MQVLRAMRREEVAQKGICKIIGIKMGNILSIYVNQTWLKHKSYLRSELARTLFSIESTNNKIKITHHRLMGGGCIWEEILLMNAF